MTGILAEMQKAQLWMVAGFLMLGWVLARRQLKLRKRINEGTRVAHQELKKLRERKEPTLPLADAPPETQRWQAAMFDLQRELKAELDTRIGIVQTLVNQLDQRIATVSQLTDSQSTDTQIQSGKASPVARRETIADLSRQGHTADEIAVMTGLPVGDVELMLGTVNS